MEPLGLRHTLGLHRRRFLGTLEYYFRWIVSRAAVVSAWIGAIGFIFVIIHYQIWVPPPQGAGIKNPPSKFDLYWEEFKGRIGMWSFMIGGFGSLLGVTSAWLGTRDDELRPLQKERVRLLRGFTDPALYRMVFGKVAIFGTVKDMLKRLDDRANKNVSSDYRLMLLMCIPTLDSGEGLQPGEWGREFTTLIEKIKANPNVNVELCHLANDSRTGISHMRDFIEVLAFKIANGDPARFRELFDVISKKTAQFLERCTHQDLGDRIKIHPPLASIPFQMFCVLGPDIKSVVVSFAGREILEREDRDEPVKPVGIFSTDPYVVEEFAQVYREYVTDTGRLPVAPLHTEKIIRSHNSGDKKVPHMVRSFLNLKFPIEIADGGYSPAIGNSAKFTARVLALESASYVGTNRTDPYRILEIGAGSGVLSFVAIQALEAAEITNWQAVLTESEDEPLKALAKNVTASGHAAKISVAKGTLKAKPTADGNEFDCEPALTDKFDLVIADLPFVDSKCEDGRFYDHHHNLHAAAFKSGVRTLLKPGGRLVTAFSSLGGASDIARFENLICTSELSITHKTSFVESGYLWIAYVLKRTDDMGDAQTYEDYWWKGLNAQSIQSVL